MRLAATKSAIVWASVAVRLETLVFSVDLLAFLPDFRAFNFFTPASRGTPHILIRIMLPDATKVIELWQTIEEYEASVRGGRPCSMLNSKNSTAKWRVITSGLSGPRKDLFCRFSRIRRPSRGFGNGRDFSISLAVRGIW